METGPFKDKEASAQDRTAAMERMMGALRLCTKSAARRPDGGIPVLERDLFHAFSELFPALGRDEYLLGLQTLIEGRAQAGMDLKAIEAGQYEFVTFETSGFRAYA